MSDQYRIVSPRGKNYLNLKIGPTAVATDKQELRIVQNILQLEA